MATDISYDLDSIVKLLKKKKRASATELGTDANVMALLEKADIVRQDGKIKLSGRGRPPVAWVLIKGASLDQLPEVHQPKKRDGSVGITQAQIDKVIAEVKNENCKCDIGPGTSLREIYFLGSGCAAGQSVCSVLDAIRRRLNVVSLPAHGILDYLHWVKETVEDGEFDDNKPGYEVHTPGKIYRWNTNDEGLPLPKEVGVVFSVPKADVAKVVKDGELV